MKIFVIKTLIIFVGIFMLFQLTVGSMVNNFKEEWLDEIIPYHPEYCYLEFCDVILANGDYESEMLNKKPIGNGIITCLNKKQALRRKGKGEEAAKAVLSILNN